jgi:hypothetical protein
MVMVDGAPRVGCSWRRTTFAPDWPEGHLRNRSTWILWVEDFAPAHARVMSLGARVLREAEPVDDGDTFQVYADPRRTPLLSGLDRNGPKPAS